MNKKPSIKAGMSPGTLVYIGEQKDSVTWFNITGIHDTKLIASIGSQFGLHSLVLEDIVNSEQRSKIDDYGDYLFAVGICSQPYLISIYPV